MAKEKEKFIQLMRSEETKELMKDSNAFTLLALIAYRAKRTDGFSKENLEIGEALIGDHANVGMTRGQYREATKRLKKYGFATTRTTNKGTITKITNSRVFDINPENRSHQRNHPTTIKQPSSNHPTTTNKNVIREKNEIKRATKAPDDLTVTEKMKTWAIKKGFAGNIEQVTESFLDWHRSKGNKFEDWIAAWRNWIRKEVKYSKSDDQESHKPEIIDTEAILND